MAQKPRSADYTKEYNCKVRHNAMRRAELALATGLTQAATSLIVEDLPDQEAVYLSAGLINLLNLMPVDTIYLAGDICCRYELLAQRLQREISAKTLGQSKGNIKIYPSSQNPNAGVLAAADVVFSKFFTV